MFRDVMQGSIVQGLDISEVAWFLDPFVGINVDNFCFARYFCIAFSDVVFFIFILYAISYQKHIFDVW
jgi:hypothetical protein